MLHISISGQTLYPHNIFRRVSGNGCPHFKISKSSPTTIFTIAPKFLISTCPVLMIRIIDTCAIMTVNNLTEFDEGTVRIPLFSIGVEVRALISGGFGSYFRDIVKHHLSEWEWDMLFPVADGQFELGRKDVFGSRMQTCLIILQFDPVVFVWVQHPKEPLLRADLQVLVVRDLPEELYLQFASRCKLQPPRSQIFWSAFISNQKRNSYQKLTVIL